MPNKITVHKPPLVSLGHPSWPELHFNVYQQLDYIRDRCTLPHYTQKPYTRDQWLTKRAGRGMWLRWGEVRWGEVCVCVCVFVCVCVCVCACEAYLEHVVAIDVSKITANLSAHVPATEWGTWKLHTSHVQHDIRNSWQGIPPQTKFLKPVIAISMCREREREREREWEGGWGHWLHPPLFRYYTLWMSKTHNINVTHKQHSSHSWCQLAMV